MIINFKMYTIAFIIIAAVLLLTPLFSVVSRWKFNLVAKAGKVDKFFWRYKRSSYVSPQEIQCGNEKVNVSELPILYVHGNSMKDYDIFSGQYVFVEPYMLDNKSTITTYPVLVFEITKQIIQSKYKLRKFVDYIYLTDIDWSRVYDKNKDRIKVTEEEFVNECMDKQSKLEDNSSQQYILSETYDEEKQRYAYSMHPVSTLYAKVKYVCSLS